MISELPDDILQLICHELLTGRDFATLYNCAVSSKRLAPCALSDIYRIYNEAMDDDEEADAFQNIAQLELSVQRWAIKWRSITLSALNETLFPYHRYLRAFDLRDLGNLLGDERFRGKIERAFFHGSMARFKREREVRFNPKKPPRKLIDQTAVASAIGDAIIPNTDTIEQLSGALHAPALARWAPSLRRLQRLELYIGRALMGKELRQAIYDNCPHLNSLSLYSWPDPSTFGQTEIDASEPDRELGAFLQGLPENSLASFQNLRECGIEKGICLGLARHARSLTDLRLCIEKEGLPHLISLENCINVRRLKLDITGVNPDENSIKQEDANGLTTWLRECHQIRSIDFHEAGFAPTILTPVLQSSEIHLEELSIDANNSWYSMKDNRPFHQAIANQKTLRTLTLFGDAAEVMADDNSALVDSVSQCTQLKYLMLRGVSEYLTESAVAGLLIALPQLEEFHTQGLNLGDSLLDYVADHTHLRSLNFMDLTSFSFEGLLNFVQNLDETKRNFALDIPMASNEALLSDEEVQIIRQTLFDKVGGKFEYSPFRDVDAVTPELESD